jgi:3-hydroxybutyryl-CoA dehydrogenase
MPPTVAIIGAGPLGRWLAMSAARAGYTVLLEDVMPMNLHHAREAIRQQLGHEALPSVTFTSTIEDAVRQADLVIDCVPDELESKLEIFWLLDRMAPPRAVFATPSTRLSITDLSNCTYRPQKCISIVIEAKDITGSLAAEAVKPSGAPIRLRTGLATSAETITLLVDFWRQLGFVPSVEAEAVAQTAR